MNLQGYIMDDCGIEVPDGFRDRSVHVLEWTTPTNERIALVIAREVLDRREPDQPPTTEDLEKFVAAETSGFAARFAGFRSERDDGGVTKGGFPFRRKAFRWKQDAEVLYHHHAFVLLGDRVLVATASAKAREHAKVDAVMDRMLDKLRLRRNR